MATFSPSKPVLIGIICGVLVGLSLLAGMLEKVELWALDTLFALRGERKGAADIIIVTIDADAVQELGEGWPPPRALYGRLLDKLQSASPSVIGIDILFDGASVRGSADDAVLRDAILGAGNVVLATATVRATRGPYAQLRLISPPSEMRDAAAATGVIGHERDSDGALRRARMQQYFGDQQLETFASAVHRIAMLHNSWIGAQRGMRSNRRAKRNEFIIN